MEKKTAEEQLIEIATKAGTTRRRINELVDEDLRDTENYGKKMLTIQQQQVDLKQLALLDINTRIAGMQAIITENKLNQLMNRKKRTEKFKSFFTFNKSKPS